MVAIGWNLEKYFENDFEYLLLNQMEKCFNFIEECFSTKEGKLFVHCHKGLSRSATVVIAYEMRKMRTDFDTVLHKIRKNRSFIMPNIGFQAQLEEFKNQNYSLDMESYSNFNVINFIKRKLPHMLKRINVNYNAYKTNDSDKVDELFELTLYTHQCHKLKEKDKLNENDIKVLNECIKILRQIQVEFVLNQQSINRFDLMFKSKTRQIGPDNDDDEASHPLINLNES